MSERPRKWRRGRRWLAGLGIVVAVLVAAVGVTWLVLDEPRPEGRGGPAADALARRMVQAVNGDAWERTGAVRWTFSARNEHLWDRERDLARVRWDDVEVLLRVGDWSGRAFRGGAEVSGEGRDELLSDAHARFINDSYWLNPVVKVFDDGVTREIVELESGEEALLVAYGSGGLTPGDAYLWMVDDDGLPRAWKMWVSIIPVGGVHVTFEGWQTLSTGAKVSTLHQMGPLTVELEDVAGAERLDQLVSGDDPFARLP